MRLRDTVVFCSILIFGMHLLRFLRFHDVGTRTRQTHSSHQLLVDTKLPADAILHSHLNHKHVRSATLKP